MRRILRGIGRWTNWFLTKEPRNDAGMWILALLGSLLLMMADYLLWVLRFESPTDYTTEVIFASAGLVLIAGWLTETSRVRGRGQMVVLRLLMVGLLLSSA